jgi:hypothetical protein
MNKTFVQAPRPKPPLNDAIVAFERGGLGHDTRNAIRPVEDVERPTNDGRHEEMKRLSIDLVRSLHRRFKTACSRHETTMIDEVVGFIEQRTAELEAKE